MAGKSVSLESLVQVDASDVLSILSQENASLRLELTAQKIVIERLKNYVQSLSADSDSKNSDDFE